MTRRDLLSSPEYWMGGLELKLYQILRNFIDKNAIDENEIINSFQESDRVCVAEFLLTGTFTGGLELLTKIALKCGFVPASIEYINLEEKIQCDEAHFKEISKNKYE